MKFDFENVDPSKGNALLDQVPQAHRDSFVRAATLLYQTYDLNNVQPIDGCLAGMFTAFLACDGLPASARQTPSQNDKLVECQRHVAAALAAFSRYLEERAIDGNRN